MAIIINNPALVTQLLLVFQPVELVDSEGKTLGTFHPGHGRLPPGVRSPYSDEEIERQRRQSGGRLLADILYELESDISDVPHIVPRNESDLDPIQSGDNS